MNFNNFTIKSQEAIQKAIEIARGAGNQAIEPVHLLKGVMTEGESLINFIFSNCTVYRNNLTIQIRKTNFVIINQIQCANAAARKRLHRISAYSANAKNCYSGIAKFLHSFCPHQKLRS